MRKFTIFVTQICFLVALLGGCSDKGQSHNSSTTSKEPIKLKVYGYSSNLTTSEFQKYFVDPVQKKLPHISFELITREADVNTPEQLIAAGNYPDLLFVSNIYIGMFKDLGMTMDISEMVKKISFI
jgi:multiple sugar transport system substrate-binding protein